MQQLDQNISIDHAQSEPVKCPQQVNDLDCGMCIAGFALTVALGADIGRAPAEYPSDVRAKWHSAFLRGFNANEAVVLNDSFLAV